MNEKKYSFSQSDAKWKENLTELEYHVLRNKGTEAPSSGKYNDFDEEGKYYCNGCNKELFASKNKFSSSCGWPSFDNETESANIEKVIDNSLGMSRTEILCSNCGGHLGHIFNDGPTPTGQRYCVNSVAIRFKKQ